MLKKFCVNEWPLIFQQFLFWPAPTVSMQTCLIEFTTVYVNLFVQYVIVNINFPPFVLPFFSEFMFVQCIYDVRGLSQKVVDFLNRKKS